MNRPLVIISEGDVVGNKGAVAMVYCILNGIKRKFPNAHFVITSKFIRENRNFDEHIEILYDNEQAFDIPLIKVWIWWVLKKIGINLNVIENDRVLRTYKDADLVVSASGISFHDNFGFSRIYHFSKYVQIPFFLDKKVIKFTQSIGPFNSFLNTTMAKLVLSRTTKIFARGIHSQKNLESIGITENVHTFPDIAVTMEARKSILLQNILDQYQGKTIIGISPNIVCKKLDQNKNYIPALIDLSKHILNSISNSIILLIPHTIEESNLNNEDDFSICNQIKDSLGYDERCEIINTLNYEPEEIKWLISKCDFFIGSRFHSLIASISKCVPSIAIGWHWKYEEMMDWFNIENNILQYWELSSEKLIEMFNKNFENKSKIKSELNNQIKDIKRKADEAIDIICEELNEKN